MNPVIIVALIIQSAIAKSSHVAGAVVGFLITTGILLWGLSVYSTGGGMMLFGIPFSRTGFIVACIIWYLFDTAQLFGGEE